MNRNADDPGLTAGQKALCAFRRDLPRLLIEKPGQWVAYHGDQQIGIAATALELYQECNRRGIKGSDYIVRSIEPELPEVIDNPYPFN
jgi:hypothetical protein